MNSLLRALPSHSSSRPLASSLRILDAWRFQAARVKTNYNEIARGEPHTGMSFVSGPDGASQRGLVWRPMLWDELKELVDDGSVEALSKLGRMQEGIMVYRAYRGQVCLCSVRCRWICMSAKQASFTNPDIFLQMLEIWDSMQSCMFHTLWDWPYNTTSEGKRSCSPPDDASMEPIWRANVCSVQCQAAPSEIQILRL
jgi:hypothetical protein